MLVKDKMNRTCGELSEKELNGGKERKMGHPPSMPPSRVHLLLEIVEKSSGVRGGAWLPSLT